MNCPHCNGAPAPDGSPMHQRGCKMNPGEVIEGEFAGAQGRVAAEIAAGGQREAVGARVTASPDAIMVNGVALNLLDGPSLFRGKDTGDMRFIVMPVPANGVVLLTFGHTKSPDQYCFQLHPEFAEQFAELLRASARKARGVNSIPPT